MIAVLGASSKAAPEPAALRPSPLLPQRRHGAALRQPEDGRGGSPAAGRRTGAWLAAGRRRLRHRCRRSCWSLRASRLALTSKPLMPRCTVDGGGGDGVGARSSADRAARAVHEGRQRVRAAGGACHFGIELEGGRGPACSCRLLAWQLQAVAARGCGLLEAWLLRLTRCRHRCPPPLPALPRRRPGVLVLVNDTDWELW